MLILALESAVEGFSVALLKDHQLLGQIRQTDQRQMEQLLPAVHALLERHEIPLSSLDLIAYSQGPGAFGGIRVSIAITQALSWVHNIPVMGISTLQAVAQASYRKYGYQSVIPVLDARMNEIYIAAYQRNLLDGCFKMCLPDQLQPYGFDLAYWHNTLSKDSWVCGNGHSLCINAPFVEATAIVPEAQDIANIAALNLSNGESGVSAIFAQPVYLRENAWKTIEQQTKSKTS